MFSFLTVLEFYNNKFQHFRNPKKAKEINPILTLKSSLIFINYKNYKNLSD